MRSGAQRQADVAADEHKRKVNELIAGFEADLAALRLTSPAGNNALTKLQALSNLDPGNPILNTGYEEIVAKYIGLSQRASSTGRYDNAQNLLDRAAGVFADSPALEIAREELVSLRRDADASTAAVPGQTETQQSAKVEAENPRRYPPGD